MFSSYTSHIRQKYCKYVLCTKKSHDIHNNAENITKHSSQQSGVPIPDLPTQDARMFDILYKINSDNFQHMLFRDPYFYKKGKTQASIWHNSM
jgi:hypothetical protein